MLIRELEPELMEQESQVIAYAQADFEIPHGHFIELLQRQIPADFSGNTVDLGCGPGDISNRVAKVFPKTKIHAVDGSKQMLDYGKSSLAAVLQQRIYFIQAKLPEDPLPREVYDLIISNSLLHHLPDPQVLWKTVKKYSKSGTIIAIMDLLRPAHEAEAISLVELYAANEAAILKRDFYHSLKAAFTLEEIKQQLTEARLNFSTQRISDHHVFITGTISKATNP